MTPLKFLNCFPSAPWAVLQGFLWFPVDTLCRDIILVHYGQPCNFTLFGFILNIYINLLLFFDVKICLLPLGNANAKSPRFHVYSMTTFSCQKTNLELVLKMCTSTSGSISNTKSTFFSKVCAYWTYTCVKISHVPPWLWKQVILFQSKKKLDTISKNSEYVC